jgi:hypothetical protein
VRSLCVRFEGREPPVLPSQASREGSTPTGDPDNLDAFHTATAGSVGSVRDPVWQLDLRLGHVEHVTLHRVEILHACRTILRARIVLEVVDDSAKALHEPCMRDDVAFEASMSLPSFPWKRG